MSKPVGHTASSPIPPPSVPSRAVDVARRAHEREGTRDSDFQNPAGKVLRLCGCGPRRIRGSAAHLLQDQLDLLPRVSWRCQFYQFSTVPARGS